MSPKCLKEYAILAERCLHNSPKHRPTMAEVLFSLESVLAIQEKFNNSLQSASKTTFGRVVNLHNSPKHRPTMAEVLPSLEPVQVVQEKFNNSLQSVCRTLFGRMVNLFLFPSNQENSVQGDLKLSTNSKDINMLSHVKEVPAHFRSPSPKVKTFKFSDLKKATRSFSPDLILGEGGFGKVFLGWVKENTLAPSKQGVGMAVAVKRLNKESTQGAAEWQAEVNFLGHMDHPNIIRLLGYCRDELEHLLVYEYMPNISFDRFLFSDTAEPLSWGTRLLIMIGVARGLTYLHLKNIIHRYLEPSTILLDENFNAKLGGFGLARYNSLKTGETYVTTPVTGTYGYAAPEYIATGHLTTKCDIYSFGVVLLVSITGQKAMDVHRPEGQQRLVEWATHIGSNIKKIMDPCLEGKYPRHGASEYVALALRCVAENPKHRPSAEEVLQSLEQIYATQKYK